MASTADGHAYSVADFMDDVRAMLEALGPEEGALEQAGRLMRHLTDRDDLYPETSHADLADDFQSVTLYGEPDGSLALLLAHVPASEQPVIHGHGAWGVACGYKGAMLLVRYERRDNGARAGYAEVVETGRTRLERGAAAWWPTPPGDVHSLEARDGQAAWVLLLLGGSAERERLVFDPEQRRVWAEPGALGCRVESIPR